MFRRDKGVTPSVTFGYDISSRLITIDNANVTISREYFNDNLLKSETETTGVARTVTYTYDADGNRASLQFPGYSFSYNYTGRNQLKNIISGTTTLATFGYDLNGNVTSRDLGGGVDGSTSTNYSYDELDRVTSITHAFRDPQFEGGYALRTLAYGYETNSNNRKWTKRIIPDSSENNKGEVFDYDQVIGVLLNVLNPEDDAGHMVPQTIIYDANGNRTSFSPYGTTEIGAYLYGPSGLAKNLLSGNYYYQDGSGSTSHLADSSGALLEWYRYDLQGTPMVNGQPGNTQSAYGVRHLFTGQQWYKEVVLYDLRNRFYSPDIGRFLQPDPIDFDGDATNLYRYCGNNPVNWSDPSGLERNSKWPTNGFVTEYPEVTIPEVIVTGAEIPNRGVGPLDRSGGAPGEGSRGRIGDSPIIDYKGPNQTLIPVNNGQTERVTIEGDPTDPPPPPPLWPALWSTFGGGPSWSPFWTFLSKPPRPDQIAWTDKGKWPTLIATGVVLAPLAAPETGLYAAYAASNAAVAAYSSAQYYAASGVGYGLANQQATIDFTTGLFNIPGDTFAPTSVPGVYGWLGHYLNPWAYPNY